MKNLEKNLDDIIFEHRNKDYGAYALRKNYNKNMMSAIIIAIVIFLLGVSVPLLAGFFNNDKTVVSYVDPTVVLNTMTKDKIPDKLPEIPVEKKRIPAFKAPVVIDTDVDVPDDLSDLIDHVQNTNPADTAGDIVDIPDNTPDTKIIDEGDELKIHTFVEEWPEFPGGNEARVRFLSESIKYPKVAKESGIQGTVHLTFVVEKDGNISNVAILRGIGGGCDEEATRVIGSMPKWKPGRQNGKEVRVQFNMPISFKLM
ncbi:MAG TPA: TonB family protein [Bacteroidales bacterium]|mgnify:CR=1 FL=1|nr:TonB family protein [Bacteroidales bacterium]